MNNLNSQQLAELLARKCVTNIYNQKSNTLETILQSIPLVELLELISIAEASLTDLQVLDMFPEQLALRNKCININNKLTQILEGATKE